MATLIDRRHVLQLMGLAGVGAFLAACAPGAISSATASAAACDRRAPRTGAAAACAPVIPEETAGPFPGDGTNGPDVLTESGVVRSDITTSLRRVVGHGRGRAADDPAPDPGRGQRLRAARGRRGLHLALRPRGPLLALLPGRRGPELPARRPGGRRRRDGDVHQHLPGLLLGPLAAHPLRGLPDARPRRPTPATGSRRRRSPCRRTSATRSTADRATSRASRTCSR